MTDAHVQAIQDRVDPENPCFGCGPQNPDGFRIKSTPRDDGVEGLAATWVGGAHHAGSAAVLGGGVQATLVDCHGIWTAVDHAARRGDDPVPHYVTAELHMVYKRPAPLNEPVTLTSKVTKAEGRRVWVEVELTDPDGAVCSRGEVVCHRLDEPWGPNPYHGAGLVEGA